MLNIKGNRRLEDETYKEYVLRRSQENQMIEQHLKGTPLKDGELGPQRKRYLQKKKERTK